MCRIINAWIHRWFVSIGDKLLFGKKHNKTRLKTRRWLSLRQQVNLSPADFHIHSRRRRARQNKSIQNKNIDGPTGRSIPPRVYFITLLPVPPTALRATACQLCILHINTSSYLICLPLRLLTHAQTSHASSSAEGEAPVSPSAEGKRNSPPKKPTKSE